MTMRILCYGYCKVCVSGLSLLSRIGYRVPAVSLFFFHFRALGALAVSRTVFLILISGEVSRKLRKRFVRPADAVRYPEGC